MNPKRLLPISALLAITIFTGTGCNTQTDVGTTSTPQTMPTAGTVPDTKPEPNVALPRTEPTSQTLAEGEIGFTVSPPKGWGTFTMKKETDELGEVLYLGRFSEKPGVEYHAVDPTTVLGRGGYPGDNLGYAKTETGFQINVLGNFPRNVPGSLIVSEASLANGYALLVEGTESDGPSPFPNEPGELVAYLNITNGPLPGGVFIAEPTVTSEELRMLLSDIALVK